MCSIINKVSGTLDDNPGFGLELFGEGLGLIAQQQKNNQQYRKDVANYKRQVLLINARRDLGTLQYREQLFSNLDVASRSSAKIQQRWNDLKAEFRQKQFESFVKVAEATGRESAKGMLGKTARRIATIRRGQAGVNIALLGNQLVNHGWRLNDELGDIQKAYEAANERAYIKSGIGQIGYAGEPPKLRRLGFFEMAAPFLGVTGKYLTKELEKPDDGLKEDMKIANATGDKVRNPFGVA